MPPENNVAPRRRWIWIVLSIFALGARLSAAFLLPDPEQDAYSYVEQIAQLSQKLSTGHFRLPDFFGFWLPLFQFAAAIPNIWIDHPLLTGKILSALLGSTSCLLVFAITEKLTRNIVLACVGFVVVLCHPFHILYSAASMTDVPYGCLVLASLWFVLRERWATAALVGALAEGVRLEAWMLIFVIPIIQFARHRRVSIVGLVVLLLPPLAWFAISFAATGDPFAYFAQRAAYQSSYLDFYPTRHGFALTDIRQDLDYFLLGANPVAFLAIIAASGLSIFHAVRRPEEFSWRAAAVACYAIAIFGFLLIAYLTKRQPVILPRYGLIFFLIGLPLLAWLIDLTIDPSKIRGRFIAFALLLFCLWQSWPQISSIRKALVDFRAQKQIAGALVAELQQSPDANARCFSDDPAVRVLSGLPADRFVRSEAAPAKAWQDAENFESYLREQHVVYLVFLRVENSLPVKIYPQLGRDPKIDIDVFHVIAVAFSPFGPDVWLYRLPRS